MLTPSDAATPALQLDWAVPALQTQLATLWPGLVVQAVARTGSTNTDLLARARTDASACLRVAEAQTAGRGRQGKPWQSALGASLTFSLAVPLAPARWDGLSLAVGLALAEALDPLDPAAGGQPPRLVLKWPNDLLLRDAAPGPASAPAADAPLGRKLGGILIETVASGAQRVAVIGVGLNILPPPAPAAGEAGFSWGHAHVGELHAGLSAPQALARVAPALLQAVMRFEADGFAALQARYAQRDALAGQAVATTLPELPQGVADGVDDSGTLWLRVPDGAGGTQRRAVISGEVSLRRLGPGASPC